MSTELIICPLCAREIHRHLREPIATRVAVPSSSGSRTITNILLELAKRAEQERLQELADAEQACIDHYQSRHRRRLWLWRRLRWAWLMRWPPRKYKHSLPDQQIFGPLQFIHDGTSH